MNFLFSAKLFVLCLFHECVNTRSWRALFVRFWFIYVKVAVCYLFFSFRFAVHISFFLEPDCLKTLVYNQCIFKNDVQFRMRNVHDFWIYVCYYTCTYKRKVYTVWTVNDVIGRIRIHIPRIYIDINLFGYIPLKTGISPRYTTQNVIDGPQYMLCTIQPEEFPHSFTFKKSF